MFPGARSDIINSAAKVTEARQRFTELTYLQSEDLQLVCDAFLYVHLQNDSHIFSTVTRDYEGALRGLSRFLKSRTLTEGAVPLPDSEDRVYIVLRGK